MIEWLNLHLTTNFAIWISVVVLLVITGCFKLAIICRQKIRARKMGKN